MRVYGQRVRTHREPPQALLHFARRGDARTHGPIRKARPWMEVAEDPRSKVKVSMTTGMTRKYLESSGRRTVYIYHPLVYS